MTSPTRTLNDIRRIGLTALSEALGAVDTIRFLQQFDSGSGDYTKQRAELLGHPALDEVLRELDDVRSESD